jgi:large subunit ribosomal protein L25
MIQVSIPAAIRTTFGKGESRRLRMKDITPAVLYCGGVESMALQFDSGLLYKNLFDIHGRNAVVTLNIDGDDKGERHVLVKEIQKNPVTDRLVHVDFLEIALEKSIVFTVPLKYVGTAQGVDLGGELQIAKNSVKLSGSPLDIPDFIEVNITALERGDGLTVADISVPDKVEMLEKSEAACVTVY